MSIKKTHNKFIEEMNKIQPNLTILGKYINAHKKILVEDNYGIQYYLPPYNLLQGSPISIQVAVNKKLAFSIKMSKINPNLTIVGEYKKDNEKILVKDELDIFYLSTPTHLLSGKLPSIKTALNKNICFIKKAVLIHGDRYDYSKVQYVNNRTKIKIICNKCHETFLQTPNAHLRERGCGKCISSRGEMKIEQILKKYNLFFITQKKFDNCINITTNRKLPFDFYLPEYNILIEYDGEMHFKPHRLWSNNDEKLISIQFRDQIKTKYCIENNIKLIRIPYFDFKNIEKILEKELL